MSDVIAVTAASFEAEVVERSHHQPVLLDLWASWCGPCQMLKPVLEELTAELGGKLRLATIDTEAEAELAARLEVGSIPDVRLYRDGAVVDRFVGFRPKDQLLATVAPFLESPGDELAQTAANTLDAGDPIEAQAQAEAALERDPQHRRALAVLLRAAIAGGHIGTAESALERLRCAPGGARLADELEPQVTTAREAAAVADAAPDSTEGRYARALAAIQAGDDAAALELLLAIVQVDKTWRDGAARGRMLEIFERRGKGDELAESYRRQLAMALF